ncbi:unnamed protein product [Nippostrongylus brasiliensis]|uniref:Secreted protein n=1 Tax=Nippostrongylus brasiliensis TaxID=27835 RepID=A0A0N4Y857_NIPBR|nr:unnamed protein product [Nippostrongylus brasiliensis]
MLLFPEARLMLLAIALFRLLEVRLKFPEAEVVPFLEVGEVGEVEEVVEVEEVEEVEEVVAEVEAEVVAEVEV